MKLIITILFLIASVSSVLGYSGGPPDNRCGNPPLNAYCTQCHSTFALNSGNGSLVLSGLPPDGFVPNQTYPLTLTLNDPGQLRWGFEITSEYQSGSSWLQAGTFAITQPTQTQLSTGSGTAPDFVKHTSAGTFAGTSGPHSWQFNWTAPDASMNAVNFYAAGNAANNNGGNNGDYIYGVTYALNQYTPPPPEPPVVAGIPDQTVPYSSSVFEPINLDDYVSDPDTPDSLIIWTASAGEAIQVDIVDRVANIDIVIMDWYGSETITFTAADPNNLTDTDDAVFTVTAYPPVVSDIPDQTVFQGENFAVIDLNDYVADPDTPDGTIVWQWSGNAHLNIELDGSNVATVTPIDSTWNGSETVTFTAVDETNQSDSDETVFTVSPASVEARNGGGIPSAYALNPPYPKPFNPETTIAFALPRTGIVQLNLFDSNGRTLRNLYTGSLSAGYYGMKADMRDLASGIYLVSLKSGEFSAAEKIVLLK